ncbi:MAG: agmatinase [Thermoguttaceae bacterium]
MTASFFTLPEQLTDIETARCVVIPIPYDGTASFLKGTVRGPDAILTVADQVEHIDEETRCEYWRDGIAVVPPIPPQATPDEEVRVIEETVRDYETRYKIFSSPTRFPIVLGGEHSVTPPVVRVAAEVVPQLSVLQFDAHSDLRDSFTGTRYSHGSAMRRVLESTENIVQVGIRSFSAEELRDVPERIDAIITPAMIEDNIERCIETILARLTRNVYITIDIDGFDPAFAPATGTPEPGGLTWRQVTRILRRVCESRNVVGADIVEVSPRPNEVITEFLAARLAGKLMAYTSR